jgi:putative membrane protein
MFFSAILTFYLVGMVPLQTPDTSLMIFVSGACAICAMILPGISGSFILVLMGKYQSVLDALSEHDLTSLIIFAMGCLVGIISLAQVVGWLLKKHHNWTIAILTGLIIGSLRKVWPWKEILTSITDPYGKVIPLTEKNIIPAVWNTEVTLALVLVVAGLLVVILFDQIAHLKIEKHSKKSDMDLFR